MRSFLLFAGTLASLAVLTHRTAFLAGNDASRFAQIESMVDYGTPSIDESRYRWTVDRVRIEGRDYSNKPPFFSLVGAAVYALLKAVGRISFATNEGATIYWLVLLLVGLPTASLVVVFYRFLRRYDGTDERARLLATAALAGGTILTSFSTTLNNHTPAAALLFAAWTAGFRGKAACAGACLALAGCVDIVPAMVFAPVIGAMLHRRGGFRPLRTFALTLACGALPFFGSNWIMTGHLVPPKMVSGALDYSSGFAPRVAGVLLPGSPWYPFACLFGWHGFFSVSPVLLVGLAGWWQAIRHGHWVPRGDLLLSAAAAALLIAGHAVFVGSFGGWSYGFRYLIPLVPLILLFIPAFLARRPLAPYVLVLLVSGVFALLGAYHPWPPGYEQEANKHPVASMVRNPMGGNLAAWSDAHFPDSRLSSSLGARFISRDEVARLRYLYLFFGSKGDWSAAQSYLRRLPPE